MTSSGKLIPDKRRIYWYGIEADALKWTTFGRAVGVRVGSLH